MTRYPKPAPGLPQPVQVTDLDHLQQKPTPFVPQNLTDMNATDTTAQYQLEELLDAHGVAGLLEMLAEVCNDKAAHCAENWQDAKLGKQWEKVATQVQKCAETKAVTDLNF